jgi:hypothetical protein
MPPIRHLVFFKFLASSTAAQQQRVSTELCKLPSVIPNILFYQVYPIFRSIQPGHPDLSGGYSMVIDSIFADAAALSVYAPHPAHQGVISQFIAPIREDNLVVDFALSERFNVDAWKQLQVPPHLRHFVVVKVKEEYKEEGAAIRRELAELQSSIPVLLSGVDGEQRQEDLYQGYNDRSKGFVHAVEFAIKDKEGLKEYLDHPAHIAFSKKNLPKLDSAVVFDYEA